MIPYSRSVQTLDTDDHELALGRAPDGHHGNLLPHGDGLKKAFTGLPAYAAGADSCPWESAIPKGLLAS